jgi:hypothetical protein
MATQGQMVVGYSLASLDRPHEGHAHLEKAIALYDPKRQRPRRLGIGANEGVIALNASAMYLWMMGYPERARQRMDEAVALAFKLDHPFSVCYGLFHHSLLNLWLGFPEVTRERTRALLELTAEHEFQIWSAVGTCVRGMALVMLGSIDQGVRMIEDGIHVYRALKTPPIFYPILLSMQASAYGIAARPQEGMPLINEALQLGAQVKGKVFAPEQLLQAALQISQELQTTMLELRAAMKLSRLWQQQGKTEQARNVLQNAYAKMTEGFEMPDLVQAQALLQELG